jgi:hypothetical protein
MSCPTILYMAIGKFDIKLVDITSALIYFGMQFKNFFLVAVPQMLLGFSLILLVYSLYVFFVLGHYCILHGMHINYYFRQKKYNSRFPRKQIVLNFFTDI